jgi:uncharacterized membrane protein YfhO
VTIKDRADFVDKLVKGSYSSKVAFVTRPTFVPARGNVLRASETANHATIDVESFGNGYLVMSVTPHKYWAIKIDGHPVPAVVTNIAYQGISVTPGRHRVEMDYTNPLVKIGGAVSLIAATLLLLMALSRRSTPVVPNAAYQEPVHVVADDEGTHVEPAVVTVE